MTILLLKFLAFREEHPCWFFLVLTLILILILSYSFPSPLHDYLRELNKSLWNFIGIGSMG